MECALQANLEILYSAWFAGAAFRHAEPSLGWAQVRRFCRPLSDHRTGNSLRGRHRSQESCPAPMEQSSREFSESAADFLKYLPARDIHDLDRMSSPSSP